MKFLMKKLTDETLLLVESSTVLSGFFCSEMLGFCHIRCACLVSGALFARHIMYEQS